MANTLDLLTIVTEDSDSTSTIPAHHYLGDASFIHAKKSIVHLLDELTFPSSYYLEDDEMNSAQNQSASLDLYQNIVSTLLSVASNIVNESSIDPQVATTSSTLVSSVSSTTSPTIAEQSNLEEILCFRFKNVKGVVEAASMHLARKVTHTFIICILKTMKSNFSIKKCNLLN